MRAALSLLRAASSTSESREVDVRPLLYLASEVNQRFAKEILRMALEGDSAGLEGWQRNAGLMVEGLAAAAEAVSDGGNRRKGLLHLAAAVGDEPTCNLLLSIGSHSVTAAIHGVSPLHAAIQGNGSVDVVKLLLDNGAKSDINELDQNGNSPLHVAIEREQYAVVEVLLSNGAVVNSRCETGETPLQIATRKGSCRLIQLLLQNNADVNSGTPPTALAIAAFKGSKACIELLLDAGANANVADETGRFPVEIAASGGWIECVERLFSKTDPLPTYQQWTIGEVMQRANNEEPFWDATAELKTVTVGWQCWLDKLDSKSFPKKKSERQKKKDMGIIGFIYADVDKVASFLLPLTVFVLVYSHGEDASLSAQILKIQDGFYHAICAEP